MPEPLPNAGDPFQKVIWGGRRSSRTREIRWSTPSPSGRYVACHGTTSMVFGCLTSPQAVPGPKLAITYLQTLEPLIQGLQHKSQWSTKKNCEPRFSFSCCSDSRPSPAFCFLPGVFACRSDKSVLGQSPTAEVLLERRSSSKKAIEPMGALPEDKSELPDSAMHTPRLATEQDEATDMFGMDLSTPQRHPNQ